MGLEVNLMTCEPCNLDNKRKSERSEMCTKGLKLLLELKIEFWTHLVYDHIAYVRCCK